MGFDDREDAMQAASATECTGLTPALKDDAEDANARRLWNVTAARRGRRGKKARKE